MRELDALIVGGRCAGSASAYLLARAGSDVQVIDRSGPGTGTQSTHCVSPVGVAALADWGLLESLRSRIDCPPLRGVWIGDGTQSFEESFGPEFALAPRRERLDPFLQDAAIGAGASVLLRTSFRSFEPRGDGFVVTYDTPDGRQQVGAARLIGADGARSAVAEASGAVAVASYEGACAAAYAYFEAPACDRVEFHLRPPGYVTVFSTDGGMVTVVAGHRGRQPIDEGGYREILVAAGLDQRFPASSQRSRLYRYRPRTHRLRRSVGNVFLVGDAACVDSPVSGLGITSAFCDADALARFVLADDAGDRSAATAFQQARAEVHRATFGPIRRLDTGQWDLPLFSALLARVSELKAGEAFANTIAPAGRMTA